MTNKLTDDQVKAIKEEFARTLANVLYTEAEEREKVYQVLNRIATTEKNITDTVQGLGSQVLTLIEDIRKNQENGGGGATLTKFICAGIAVEDANLDKNVSNYNLLVDKVASLNTTKRNGSGTTPTSIDTSKCLNVLNTTGEHPFALLWMNDIQAIIMAGGETEHAGMITFRDNGLYDIMYVNPELGKVHRLIIGMADDELVRFKMVDLKDPLTDVEAEGLTLEVFKGHAVKSSEVYQTALERGGNASEALLAAGIEGWASSEGIDLNTVRLHIPELEEMRKYVATLVDDEETTLSEIQDNSVVSDAEIVESSPVDVQHTVTTGNGREITYTRRGAGWSQSTDNIYKVIDNILTDDGRLLNVASTNELSPRQVFTKLVLNRANALKSLDDNARIEATEIANEVFDALLPHLDEIVQEHNQSTKDVYIKSTPELVATIANNNKLHARGLSKLSEETQDVVFENIAELPALAAFEKEYDSEYESAVIDALNRIAPFDYNSEILTNGVMLNQLIVSGDEVGDAYRGDYIRNVLLEKYTKVKSTAVNLDATVVKELASTGSSSSLFAMSSEKLESIVKSINEPHTYSTVDGKVLMAVSRTVQAAGDDEDDNERVIYLYSVIDKNHANNIVIVQSSKGDAAPKYTLASSTTFDGIADVAEYVKSILI